jgi:serine/threonine protein kinase
MWGGGDMDAWNANVLIGARLGSSTLERPLGVGGMGAVYLARQERPHRHVAVKVLRPGLAADENAWRIFLARFRREADAAAALDHANIVPIYEFGEQGSLAYIVMPYLADGSLASFLAPDRLLPVEQVVAYLEQAAAALDYAHQHGIVHRDVKPSNLLLHPDGRLLLGDFGIARPLNMAELPGVVTPFEGGDLTVTGSAMGTPEYMAPEQVRGEAVSAATDTYALGVVAYTLLTGHTPFEGADINGILARQLTDTPPPLRAKRRDVSRDVEDAILWAMAKDPSHRPGSTGAFARALTAASTGVPATTGSFSTRRAPIRSLMAAHNAGHSAGRESPVNGVGLLSGGTNAHIAAPQDGPDAPTMYDGVYQGGRGGFGAPAWPSAPPPGAAAPLVMQPRTLGLLALLTAAGVLALTMAIVLASGSLGNLINLNNNNPAGIGAHATATPWPTATPRPSPTPVVNWLRVSPAQVTFGCKKGDRSVSVTLTNLGPSPVGWQTNKTWTPQITVRPESGSLGAGRKKTISLTYSPGWWQLNGTITFEADTDRAGQAPTVTYSAPNCFGQNGGDAAPHGLTPQHGTTLDAKPAKLDTQNGNGSGHARKRHS